MSIQYLSIFQWQQFKDLNIHFHQNVTFITGVNGTGKTSICRLIAKYLGYEFTFIQSLDKDNEPNSSVGFLGHDTIVSTIQKHSSDPLSYVYVLNFTHRPVNGFSGAYIKSNRDEYSSTPILSVKSGNDVERNVVNSLTNPQFQNFEEGKRIQSSIPFYSMKSSIISWALFGPGNEFVKPIPVYAENFKSFTEILRKVMPHEIGFERIIISNSDVFLKTKNGEFTIDGASSGLSTIIDICWKCFVSSTISGDNAVVIIDEPENHLHPSLQKSIMPNLVDAFPKMQFIVSTHSPHILSSLKDSKIYTLEFRDSFVAAREIQGLDRATEYEGILQGAMGVTSSMPMWASETYANIIREYIDVRIDENVIATIEKRLRDSGLEEYTLTAIHSILEQRYAPDNKANS